MVAASRTTAVSDSSAGPVLPSRIAATTYTATGFSNRVRVVFRAVFRPNLVEDKRETVAIHFRTAIQRRREETHLVDRLFFQPVGNTIGDLAKLPRRNTSRSPQRLCGLRSLILFSSLVPIPAYLECRRTVRKHCGGVRLIIA